MATFLGVDLPTWWFAVIGAVFTGYAILDGFDLGAGAIHLLFKKEESRRIALNAIGPVWDGNEVWLVIGGGALFAGFPEVYATLFSAFYIPFMLFLMVLILRAIAIEFRSKETMLWWRQMWDIVYSLASTTIAFLLGVVLGNLIQGIPIDEKIKQQGCLGYVSSLNKNEMYNFVVIKLLDGTVYAILWGKNNEAATKEDEYKAGAIKVW